MKRALETIAPFVAHTQTPVCILPDLTEACWGSCSRSEPETPPEYIQTDILKDFEGLPFHFADNKPLRPVEPESFATGLTHLHLDTPHPKLFYFNRLS
jgi:hypothetical protein